MRHAIAILTLVLAFAAAACTKNTSAPTSSTSTTSTSTTTITTTSVSTTTVPAIFTVRGTVTSEKDGTLLRFADIEIIQGVNIGKRFQGDGNGGYAMPGLSPGTFVARYWAFGYLVKDVPITVTTSDLTVNVQLTPAPPPTTTTFPINASFSWSPNPCTIAPGPAVTCTVDGSASTGLRSGAISVYHWAFAGVDIFGQVIVNLAPYVNCSHFVGTGGTVTLSVRLTVTDDAGNSSSVDQGVPFSKQGGVCP